VAPSSKAQQKSRSIKPAVQLPLVLVLLVPQVLLLADSTHTEVEGTPAYYNTGKIIYQDSAA